MLKTFESLDKQKEYIEQVISHIEGHCNKTVNFHYYPMQTLWSIPGRTLVDPNEDNVREQTTFDFLEKRFEALSEKIVDKYWDADAESGVFDVFNMKCFTYRYYEVIQADLTIPEVWELLREINFPNGCDENDDWIALWHDQAADAVFENALWELTSGDLELIGAIVEFLFGEVPDGYKLVKVFPEEKAREFLEKYPVIVDAVRAKWEGAYRYEESFSEDSTLVEFFEAHGNWVELGKDLLALEILEDENFNAVIEWPW